MHSANLSILMTSILASVCGSSLLISPLKADRVPGEGVFLKSSDFIPGPNVKKIDLADIRDQFSENSWFDFSDSKDGDDEDGLERCVSDLMNTVNVTVGQDFIEFAGEIDYAPCFVLSDASISYNNHKSHILIEMGCDASGEGFEKYKDLKFGDFADSKFNDICEGVGSRYVISNISHTWDIKMNLENGADLDVYETI